MEKVLQQTDVKLSIQPITEPDDDYSWLYIHPDTMESRLQRAAKAKDPSASGGADDLQHMATMFGKLSTVLPVLVAWKGRSPFISV